MATRVAYTFTFESMIRGYHEYQMIWGVPAIGEELNCFRELGNSHDPYAVAVKKTIGGEDMVVGHVPRRITVICSLFIRRGVQFFVQYQEVEDILRIYRKVVRKYQPN